jgi:hypothetical protein
MNEIDDGNSWYVVYQFSTLSGLCSPCMDSLFFSYDSTQFFGIDVHLFLTHKCYFRYKHIFRCRRRTISSVFEPEFR